MKQITVFLLLLITNVAFAQFRFPDLKYIDIGSSHLNGKFGFKESSNFELVNKPCEESMDCYQYGEPTILIGYWKVDAKTKIEFHYTEGPSEDPAFMAIHNGEIILSEAGTTLHFKGRTLYVEGSANAYFDKKRKFQFTNNRYEEVKQPFYHIGVKGKLNYPIQLYQTDQFVKKLAYLPKGYEVEVLVGQTGGDYDGLEKVLIKTEFGLIGWFNFKEVSFGKPLMDELYYHGD